MLHIITPREDGGAYDHLHAEHAGSVSLACPGGRAADYS